MTMMKNIIRMCFKVILLCILATWFIIGGCTAYWTKGFYIKKDVYNFAKTNDEDFCIFDNLDERFEDWKIHISIWSVLQNPYRRESKSNIYDIRFDFEHKMDSLESDNINIPPPSNIIDDEIVIDKIKIEFLLTRDEHMLLLDNEQTLFKREQLIFLRRALIFDTLIIPDDIDSINVEFEIKLMGIDGQEKAKKMYSFLMVKFVEKYRSIPPGLLH